VLRVQAVNEAPGAASLSRCPDCVNGNDCGEACLECDGTGLLVWHACIGCGDTAWQYGTDGSGQDRTRMSCRRCGAMWSAADPAWLAQRVPDRLLAVAS
jgi:hypothetical protein